MKKLGRSASDRDVVAEVIAYAANETKELPAPIAGRVTASDKAAEVAQRVKEKPEDRRKRLEEDQRREREEQQKLHAEWLAKKNWRDVG